MSSASNATPQSARLRFTKRWIRQPTRTRTSCGDVKQQGGDRVGREPHSETDDDHHRLADPLTTPVVVRATGRRRPTMAAPKRPEKKITGRIFPSAVSRIGLRLTISTNMSIERPLALLATG